MTDPFDGDVEVAELHAAQVREWSKWEAREAITVGSAPAYNVGHPVPQSNVDAHGYAKQGKVRLQHGWVAENPDDPDVKTFLAWAKAHPEHPDVQAWEKYRAERAERVEAEADANPFAETPAKAARKATVSVESKG